MAAPDLRIEFDPDMFEKGVEEVEAMVREADVESCKYNARRQLELAVKGFNYRTGNLRSSAVDVWEYLGMKGRPYTNLKPGVKWASYRRSDTGKLRSVRLDSWGRYDDRLGQRSPEFKYELYAAEWRERASRQGVIDMLNRAAQEGIIGKDEARAFRAMLFSTGGNWQVVLAALKSMFAASGIRYDFSGYWKPYSIYKKGARALVTAGEYKFRHEHAQALRGKK